MNITHNIYCDESCHLEENDSKQKFMVLGGIACPNSIKEEVFKRIKTMRRTEKFRKEQQESADPRNG